jgi:hypothetical protein
MSLCGWKESTDAGYPHFTPHSLIFDHMFRVPLLILEKLLRR